MVRSSRRTTSKYKADAVSPHVLKLMATMPCWNVGNCEGWPKCGRHHEDHSKNGPHSINQKKNQNQNQKETEIVEGIQELSREQNNNPTHANTCENFDPPTHANTCETFDVPQNAEIKRSPSTKRQTLVTSKKIQNLNPVYGNRNEYVATGLRNPSNWCYLNSAVQCLANSESIVKMVLDNQENIIGRSKWTLLNELRFLITVLRSGDYRYVTPIDLKKKIEAMQKTFTGDGQHDAHEVLTTILDGIKTEIGMERPNEKVEFEGVHKSTIRCEYCQKSHNLKDEPFNSLHIDIVKKEAPTVEEGINNLAKKERIQDYRCDNCDKLGVATKSNSLTLPDTLIVQIKRFKKDKYGISNKDHARVNFSLEMNTNGKRYELYAVIEHMGQNNGGHYKAYCKENINKQWYQYNDSTVICVDVERIPFKNAYILFYKRVPQSAEVEEEKKADETERTETLRRSRSTSVSVTQSADAEEEEEEADVTELTDTQRRSQHTSVNDIQSVEVEEEKADNEIEMTDTQRRSQRTSVRSEKGKDWDVKREKKYTEKNLEKKNTKMDNSMDNEKNVEKRRKKDIDDASPKDEFCFCKEERPGEMMIECKRCKDWYHPKCMNYNCAKCREEIYNQNTDEIEEKVMEIAVLKNNIMKKEAQIKETEGRISRVNKSNEKMIKENAKLLEKEEKNKLEKKKREQMIEEKVNRLCKSNNDELKKVNKELEELQEREKENHVVIENLKEDLLLMREENKKMTKENETLKAEITESRRNMEELATKDKICQQMEEALKLMTNNITSVEDNQSEENQDEQTIFRMMTEHSIKIRDAIASLVAKDTEDVKRIEEIKSLKKDIAKKNKELKQSAIEIEKCSADMVKMTEDNRQLQVQCQQQTESWKVLRQINKDLELKVENSEKATNNDSSSKKMRGEKVGTTLQKQRKNTDDTEIKGEESDVVVKVLAKEGDQDWFITDLSIGTVDDDDKQHSNIQYMMVIEEKEGRKKMYTDQHMPKKSLEKLTRMDN